MIIVFYAVASALNAVNTAAIAMIVIADAAYLA
jgi:hypothetical protein